MIKINILGTEYTIENIDPKDDPHMRTGDCDGYTDPTSKRIVVSTMPESDVDCVSYAQKLVLRHEIIHAFLNESGLQANYKRANEFGHDETIVDWFAIQFPKICEAFGQANCL